MQCRKFTVSLYYHVTHHIQQGCLVAAERAKAAAEQHSAESALAQAQQDGKRQVAEAESRCPQLLLAH